LQEAVVFFISIPIAFWFFSVSISSTGKSWAWKKEKRIGGRIKKRKEKKARKKGKIIK